MLLKTHEGFSKIVWLTTSLLRDMNKLIENTRATPGKPLERHRDGATTANFLIFRVRHQKLAGFHGGTLFYTTIKL